MTQEEAHKMFEFLEEHNLFDLIPGGLLSYPEKKDDDNERPKPDLKAAPSQHRAVHDQHPQGVEGDAHSSQRGPAVAEE